MLGPALILLPALAIAEPAPCTTRSAWTLVAHGGAGAWQGTAAQLARKQSRLREALTQGARMLGRGRTAVDVVEAVLVRLEDAPELNAGRGGVPNAAGFVELDAAIMRGRDRAAGAVAGVRTVKNPIRLARAVMERSPHVMFVDRGAEAFARTVGIEIAPPAYFLVDPPAAPTKSKSGTVGAVVLDRCGEIAAGTSTGGYGTKAPGRVGDVPVIGAGTYADQETAAISATGWGEWFIRYTAAHDVSARMKYAKTELASALKAVLQAVKAPAGATGGLIAVTPSGAWATHHTSPGMLRGVATHAAPAPRVGISDALE